LNSLIYYFVGINGNNANVNNDPINAIKIKVEYLLKSFLFTPTNCLLINVPIAGEINEPYKFIALVRNANTVPSILIGVIFAKSDIMGSSKRTADRILKVTSVKKRKTKSGIPHSRLYRHAKKKSNRRPVDLTIIEASTIILTSTVLKKAL
jgi:hypothetical protein